MATQTVLQRVLQGVTDFIRKEENKLPAILEEGAKFGLLYTAKLEALLNSPESGIVEALVPTTEPLKAEICDILNEVAKACKAVDAAYVGGLLFIGAGKIGQLKVGSDVPLSHVLVAVQAKYVDAKTTK